MLISPIFDVNNFDVSDPPENLFYPIIIKYKEQEQE